MRAVPAGKPLRGSGILAVKSLGAVLGDRFSIVSWSLTIFHKKAMRVSPLSRFDRPF
jgi:hypothetical protein